MDWSVTLDDAGSVIQIWADGRRENLGPRDEVFTRWADLMGDDYVLDQSEGYDRHEDPGDFGDAARSS